MTTSRVAALRRAATATMFGRGTQRVRRLLLNQGVAALDEIAEGLGPIQLDALESVVAELVEANADACFLTDEDYPPDLAAMDSAPGALFIQGRRELLAGPAVGMCGSRNAGDTGLRAAHSCGVTAARLGLTVVSGFARGVDTSTHLGALGSGGNAIGVLAEGVLRFRPGKGALAQAWDADRAVLVSQFPPTQAWTAGAAMTRNGLIVGLSRGLVVVEAGETGGTLNAGRRALEAKRPLFVLEFEQGSPPGNRLLLGEGALAVRSPDELATQLRTLEVIRKPVQATLL